MPFPRHLDLFAGRVLTNRIDEAARAIRVDEARALTAEPRSAPSVTDADPGGGHPRPRLITVDNTAYGRYAGEVQITRTDLPIPASRCSVA